MPTASPGSTTRARSPGRFRCPHLPDFSLISFDLVVNALAIAVIVLVQGAGVSESAPNADGRPSNMNRDFVAQGVGNLAAGLFRGQPVGGSVGQTALNVAAGARTRWAAIWSGIWMLVILVAFAGVVGKVAMPTLAAVLIFAAIGATTAPRAGRRSGAPATGRRSRWRPPSSPRCSCRSPPRSASASRCRCCCSSTRRPWTSPSSSWCRPTTSEFREQPAPRTLTSHQVTVLDVYGSLFYAGARTLQARLPEVADAEAPAVVLRLRGRTSLGATFFRILAAYAEQLAAAGGRLYLSGLDPDMAALLARTGRVTVTSPVRVFGATPVLGESTWAALHDAQAWVVEHDPT